MKLPAPPPQQWELLASPGHVLLAQVDSYRLKLKLKLPMILGAAAIALVYATFLVAPLLASGAGGAVGWVTKTVGGVFTEKPLAMSPAPAVSQLAPVFPPGLQVDPNIVPNLAEVDEPQPFDNIDDDMGSLFEMIDTSTIAAGDIKIVPEAQKIHPTEQQAIIFDSAKVHTRKEQSDADKTPKNRGRLANLLEEIRGADR